MNIHTTYDQSRKAMLSHHGLSSLKRIKKIFTRWLQALVFLAFSLNTVTFPCFARQPQSGRPLISYVDPFIGVDNGGNTVPGAAVPFGFANPSPDTLRH